MGSYDEIMNRLTGVSVTVRVKNVKQPRGGYINPKNLEVIALGKEETPLNPEENISGSLVGTAVDYLTRFMTGTPLNHAFVISLSGAERVDETELARELLENIKGLDDVSIISAIKLVGFDVCKRASKEFYKPVQEINPNTETIENVRKMVERSIKFFEHFGPKLLDGFTFKGGYTKTISTGDGDFITADTLWDFKVIKKAINKENTLQLLIYWRMGLHSIHPEFQNVKYLGFYNPRLNEVSRIATAKISQDIIDEVESEIIGYNKD